MVVGSFNRYKMVFTAFHGLNGVLSKVHVCRQPIQEGEEGRRSEGRKKKRKMNNKKRKRNRKKILK